MKKSRKKKLITAILTASLLVLCACSGKSGPDEKAAPSTSRDSSAVMPQRGPSEPEQNGLDLSLQLQQKYAGGGSDAYEIMQPLFNLPEDYCFEFPNAAAKYAEFEGRQDAVEVFIDANLQYPFHVTDVVDYDYDSNTLLVKPSNLFSAVNIVTDYDAWGTWGNAPKYWLVQYEDIETGETLAKPRVTMFTVKKAVGTPTIKFELTEGGYAQLSWKPVEGAVKYEIYQITGSDTTGITTASLHLAGETTA